MSKGIKYLMESVIGGLLLVILSLIPVANPLIQNVRAQQNNIACSNRYVTLVNPVRGRELWSDKSLEPILDQEKIVADNDFAATWLLQNDVFFDHELLSNIKNLNSSQEKGIFFEVSQRLADQAKVYYPIDVPWFSPKAVFLSGYSQSDRRALIDTAFNNFKDAFGFYPKSVGAWWIDSYSLEYMRGKYGISSAMIVADQKTTDSYGVWGQWWGVPYYPAKANILTPAENPADKENVVILQWAQRDPVLAYGFGPGTSNYSLQANDYIRQGKDTNYFKDITSAYLDCTNPIGQITVGLESGQESLDYIGEYQNQLAYLKSQPNIAAVTMSQFAADYARVFPQIPEGFQLNYQGGSWVMNTKLRENQLLGDRINYQQSSAFSDYFVADKSKFLSRDLSSKVPTAERQYFPWFLILIFITGIFLYYKKITVVWLMGVALALFSFGLVLRSNFQFGYQVYYGPQADYLELVQVALVGGMVLLSWLIYKWKSRIIFYPVLGFAITQMVISLRYTQLSGSRWLGFLSDPFHFLGVGISSRGLQLINQYLPGYQASALLKLDVSKIWQKPILWILIFPLLNILLGLALGLLLERLPGKIRLILTGILVILLTAYLDNIFGADPRAAIPLS